MGEQKTTAASGNRAKTYQLVLFPLNNGATNVYYVLVLSYIATFGSKVNNKEFTVYFQPQYNIYTNEIVGAEALLRWEHPTSRESSVKIPQSFFPSTNVSEVLWGHLS